MNELFSVSNFVTGFNPLTENESNHLSLAHRIAKPNESFSLFDLKIHTIPTSASSIRSKGNLGYLVEVDGLRIFHAGLHCANWAVRAKDYRKEVDFLKPFGPVDIAILPITNRHLGRVDYKQYLYLIEQLSPKAIYLIGDDMLYEEHKKCLNVLKERDIPVFYPDAGIALGQRFHYIRKTE